MKQSVMCPHTDIDISGVYSYNICIAATLFCWQPIRCQQPVIC